MTNTIFCNNCGQVIPEPDDKKVNDKYFCDEECEFEYLKHLKLYHSIFGGI